MALIINSTPGSFYSAHNDLIFVVFDSVNYTETDFKYVADIYVGGVIVSRLKAVPRPDSGMGIFNIGDVARGYLASVFNPSAAIKAQESGNGEFSIGVTVKFGEEYGGTLYTDVTVDSERFYYNYYNTGVPGALAELSGYQNKVASIRPISLPVIFDAKNYVPYFSQDGSPFDVEAIAYNSSGTQIDSYSATVTPTAAGMITLNVSPQILGFDGNTDRYQVSIDDIAYYFSIECEAKYDVYTLHFLNRFGGFETKSFNKVNRKTINIDKQTYGQLPYTIDVSGNVSYWNSNKVYNETKPVYASEYTDKLVLNSDFISDDEYKWLADLVVSPLVYIEDAEYFRQVVITMSDYEFRKRSNDNLTNLTIEVDLGVKRNAQYR